MKEYQRKYLGFNDTWFIVAGIITIGAFMPFVFFGHKLSDPPMELAINWLISFTMSVGYWFGCRSVIIFWRKRLPDAQNTLKRNVYQVLFIAAFSFILESAVGLILSAIGPSDNEPHPIAGTAGTYLIVLFITTLYEAIYLYAQWRRALIEQERVKQEHLRSQLQGLRNQVNPHFLFNSLNTLMSIVTEDQELAVRYLQKLSSVFRHVLENRHEQLIPLESELNFMENFIFLQKERFRENLRVNIDVPEDAKGHAIVPLSLQILFENAIKHNIISERKPLTICVKVNDDGKLEVSNNLQRKQQKSKSTKVGLENIQNRYRFFTDEVVDIVETETTFSVAVPLLPISKMASHEISYR